MQLLWLAILLPWPEVIPVLVGALVLAILILAAYVFKCLWMYYIVEAFGRVLDVIEEPLETEGELQ